MSTLSIIDQDGTLVVASDTIAAGSGVQHKNVLELIHANRADFDEFGGVAFETRPLATAGGIQPRQVALLNEQQATLLMTYQRNTNQVISFKKALVKAFFEMARELAAPVVPALPDFSTHEGMVMRGSQMLTPASTLMEAIVESRETGVALEALVKQVADAHA